MDVVHGNLPGSPGKELSCICGRTSNKPCQSTTIQLGPLLKLYDQVADVLHEHGCWCLAEKFKTLAANWKAQVTAAGDPTGNENDHGNNPQCYILPLTTALSTTEYYDYALNFVQVASRIDQTREIIYLRAFLYLVLGETDQAWKQYKHATQHWGNISPDELEPIRVLVHQHNCEDDISEIYQELARTCNQ